VAGENRVARCRGLQPPRRVHRETLHKGDHVLVDGLLVSSTYNRENSKSKKAKAAKVTVFWSIRANSVRRLSRAEAEVQTAALSTEGGAELGDVSF
jgi:single-stranded DNA-binding protein